MTTANRSRWSLPLLLLISGASQAATYHGVVRGDQGPLAGATVIAQLRARPTDAAAANFVSATSDSAGRFSLEVEGTSPRLRVDAAGYAPTEIVLSAAATGETITLRRGSGLSGSVRRPDGKILAGVSIEATAHGVEFSDPQQPDRFVAKTQTDGNGRFELAHLADGFYQITALSDTSAAVELSRVPISHDQPHAPLSIVLSPGFSVSGTLRTADGTPVPRGWVRAEPLGGRPWNGRGERCDKDGRFTIRGLERAPRVRISVQAQGFAGAVRTISVAPSGTVPPQTIVLEKGTTLSGRLMRSADQPFAGRVDIEIRWDGEQAGLYRNESVDLRDGRFVIAGLAGGKATVKLRPSGFPQMVRESVSLSADKPLDLGDLALPGGEEITGTVRQVDGAPAKSINVRLWGETGSWEERQPRLCRSDDSGRFAFSALDRSQRFTIEAHDRQRGSVRQVGLAPGSEPLTLTLVAPGRLHGRVSAGQPPKPVSLYQVTTLALTDADGDGAAVNSLQRGDTEPINAMTGEFDLSVQPGRYVVRVSGAAWLPGTSSPVTVVAGETTEVGEIHLERGQPINVTVLDPQRKPVSDATVQVTAPTFLLDMEGPPDAEPARTDSNGVAVTEQQSPGRYLLRVRHPEFASNVHEVVVSGDEAPRTTVVLTRGGAIEGTVRDNHGQLQSGVMVKAIPKQPGEIFAALNDPGTPTDAQGHYRIEALAAGEYLVMVGLGSYFEGPAAPDEAAAAMPMVTANVQEAATTILDFPQKSAITLTGTATADGKPFQGTLRFSPAGAALESDPLVSAKCDPQGRFRVELVARPSWWVIGATEENQSWSARIELDQQPTQQRDISLSARTARATVRAAADGSPLKGVTVTLLPVDASGALDLTRAMMLEGGKTDDEGQVALRVLAPGRWQVSAEKDGYATQRLDPISVGNLAIDPMTILLEPAKSIVLLVRDEEGRPVEGVSVLGTDLLPATSGIEGTNASGQISARSLGTGTQRLLLLARAYAPTTVTFTIDDRSPAEPIPLVIRRGQPLVITVRDEAGEPVAGAQLTSLQSNGEQLLPAVQITSMLTGTALSSDRAGRIEIARLAAGDHQVEVTAGGKRGTGKVTVKSNGPAQLTINVR